MLKSGGQLREEDHIGGKGTIGEAGMIIGGEVSGRADKVEETADISNILEGRWENGRKDNWVGITRISLERYYKRLKLERKKKLSH